MEYIKIPITQEMKDDLRECEEMVARGGEKDCHDCCLDGGDWYGCMGEYEWSKQKGHW